MIEGGPGSGKSTLIERYAWQWAEKTAEPFINNLTLLIICQGSNIEQDQDVEANIKAFLSDFDQGDSLYEYYEHNKESCLVIFEAMDEAHKEARDRVVKYVNARPPGQPFIITGRTDCFKKSPMKIDLLTERSGFTKDQAIKYFKDSFPDVVREVENLIDADAISIDFLESPYNCQNLGVLLIERNRKGESSLEDDVEFSTTLLMKLIFAEKLEKLYLDADDTLFRNLSKLALWATMEDKHRFTKMNLKKFNLSDEAILLGFFCTQKRRPENYYTFPHETEKDYLAALAITELDDDTKRDACYRILASDRKYAAVLRFISGLLDEERVRDGKEFQMMFAHAKLLGGIKHHESTHKDNILAYSKTQVKSILKTFMNDHKAPGCSETLEPKFMSAYRAECDHFISLEFTDDEKQAFLDGDNGRVCISLDMLDIFKDFYLRLKELPVTNKQDYDMIRRLIGDGIMYVNALVYGSIIPMKNMRFK